MNSSRQIEDAAAAWLARRDGGDWSPRDQARLDAWLAEATAHRVAYLRLDAAWRESDRLKALAAGRPPGHVPERGSWARAFVESLASGTVDDGAPVTPNHATNAPVYSRASRSVPRRRGLWRRVAGVVASVAALAVVVGFGWQAYLGSIVEHSSYATPIGALRTVALSDGSEATLSSNSGIALRWSRRERRTELAQGEAFFKVATDADRPFVVTAGDRHVVAVGTRFSVRRDGADLRVVVTEGVVRLESAGASRRDRHPVTLLPAGSIATVNTSGVLVRTVALADAERALDWSRGFLTFRDTPLAVAVAEFNRFNARQIIIDDPAVAALRIGGNFRWSNTDVFVRLLEQGFPVKAQRHDDHIALRSR